MKRFVGKIGKGIAFAFDSIEAFIYGTLGLAVVIGIVTGLLVLVLKSGSIALLIIFLLTVISTIGCIIRDILRKRMSPVSKGAIAIWVLAVLYIKFAEMNINY